jgi:ParB-like chromosome segregation protein Spo0J
MIDATHAYQVMPPHTPEQYAALKADIAAHGVQEPIDVDEEGEIVDGFTRARICQEFGIECPKRVVRGLRTEAEKRDYAWRMNLLRRQLTREQKRKLAKQLRVEGKTETRIAEWLGVSQATVSQWLRDLINSDELEPPKTVEGDDGKHYPTDKLRRRKTQPGASTEPVEAQTAATAVDSVHATPQAAEEAPPDEANADPSTAVRPATGPRRNSLSPSQASIAVTQSSTTDAVAGLMDDLLRLLEEQRRQGDFREEMDRWDAETRARWQERYRRLRVQLRALGVALGVESRSRPPQPSVPRLDPVRPDGTPGVQARSDPIETHPDPADVPDELDPETAEVLAVDVDDDPSDGSMVADDVLDIPPAETSHNLQEVEL